MFMFTLSASCPQCWPQWSLQLSAHVSPHICLHPRPCVWKPRSVSWPGYFFGYLPQWPPWNGCKCLVCTAPGDWPACFFAGPVFSNNAHFYGLAVFIDTYSNDDATDVSGGSGFTHQHDVSIHFFFSFVYFKLACCHKALSMLTLNTSQNLFCHIFPFFCAAKRN